MTQDTEAQSLIFSICLQEVDKSSFLEVGIKILFWSFSVHEFKI